MASQDAATTSDMLVDANIFDIDGPIRAQFSSSSIRGIPLMSYEDAGLDLTFEGDEITQAETALGQLVTVTLEEVVDACMRTFTLILPTIRVADDEVAEFQALGIETTDCSGAFVPPDGPAGVLQASRVHQLYGNARWVEP
jgi:hypothetical protein